MFKKGRSKLKCIRKHHAMMTSRGAIGWLVLCCSQFISSSLDKRPQDPVWIWWWKVPKNATIILCLWFRASLIYIDNCPTRCNTKQSIYYSAGSLNTFRVPTTSIIRSTRNSNYSLRYWSCCDVLCSCLPPTWPSLATLDGGSCTKNMTSTGDRSYNFVYSLWWVWLAPETCRVNLQNNK